MLKGFEYRLYPTPAQRQKLNSAFGCARLVYNKALAHKEDCYQQTGKSPGYNELSTTFLLSLKQELPFLKTDCPSQSLQQSIKHLIKGYDNFFKKISDYPRFKKKFADQSLTFPQHTTVDFSKSITKVIKIGEIKTIFHRKFEGELRSATISRTQTNKYYISILVNTPDIIPDVSLNGNQIGIDLGIKDYCTFSDGTKIPNPKFRNNIIKKERKLNRIKAKKKKGSKNYGKIALKVAKLYESVTNTRNDFLNKLSRKIINENQVIFLEDLGLQEMMVKAPPSLAGHIQNSCFYKFVNMLKYKGLWAGKAIIQIGRYEPSSKECSICGQKNQELQLKDREWKCTNCGTEHDRDINAAINILKFGMEQPEFKSLDAGYGEAMPADRKPIG
jgi:putative transposase